VTAISLRDDSNSIVLRKYRTNEHFEILPYQDHLEINSIQDMKVDQVDDFYPFTKEDDIQIIIQKTYTERK